MEMANRAEHMRLLATEYGRVTVLFSEALAAGQYQTARDMLAQPLKSDFPEERLKDKFERFVFRGVVTLVEAMDGYEDYPGKLQGDIGGVCVALCCHARDNPIMTHNAFLMAFVKREDGVPRIRELRWG